jgi:hypothetical protein
LGAYFLVALGPLLGSISCNSEVLLPRRSALILAVAVIVGTLLTSGTTGYVGIPLLVLAFMEEHVAKLQLEAGSGETRMFIITHNLSVFLNAPILGVGYGNERGGAAITFLLSNIGVIGTVVVYYALGTLFVHAKRALQHVAASRDAVAVVLGATSSVVVVFALGHFAQTEVFFLWPFLWVLVAIVTTAPVKAMPPTPVEVEAAPDNRQLHTSD